MKSFTATAAGNASPFSALLALLFAWAALFFATGVEAQKLYRYQDESGRWVFTDKPPESGEEFTVESLAATTGDPVVTVRREQADGLIQFIAANDCFCPAEVVIELAGLHAPEGDSNTLIREILAPRDERVIAEMRLAGPVGNYPLDYRFGYVFGDPDAAHAPEDPYRPPFGAAKTYRVSQAWPEQITHVNIESRYAVDIAMPEQSAVHAARGGTVISVSYSNFLGGTDVEKFGDKANVVRILHDDGTIATYAHLSWDSIRVRPGQRVSRGQYIAASGNTGFTTGPHLHFAVMHNGGLRLVSVPVEFSVEDGRGAAAATGGYLSNP